MTILYVIDIADPANPRRLSAGRWGERPGEYGRGLAASGHHLFAAAALEGPGGDTGLHIIDVEDPLQPRLVSSLGASAQDVVVSGDFAYLADGGARLQVIDVSDPDRPRWVGRCDAGWDWWNVAVSKRVAVSGTHAYVVEGWWDVEVQIRRWQLSVIDLSNPARPEQVGGCAAVEPRGVTVSGNYVFVVDRLNNILIFDVSDPSAPYSAGLYEAGESSSDEVAVGGNYAYTGEGVWDPVAQRSQSQLVVLDIGDPTRPRRVGGCDISGGPGTGVAVSGSYAYLVNEAGLQVIEISDPTNPVRVGHHPGRGAVDVAVSDQYAYVAHWLTDVEVIDVSHPANPRPLGTNPAARALTIAVRSGRVFTAAGFDGLGILDLRPRVAITKDDSTIGLSWDAVGPVRLQRTSQLTNPDWENLSVLGGTNLTRPIGLGNEFFRLVRP